MTWIKTFFGYLLGIVVGIVTTIRLMMKSRRSETEVAKQDKKEETPRTAAPAVMEPGPQLKPGWEPLPMEELPQPTYWPVIMALGITFIFWGVATSYIVSYFGIVIFFIALIGWIGDLRNAAEHEGHH